MTDQTGHEGREARGWNRLRLVLTRSWKSLVAAFVALLVGASVGGVYGVRANNELEASRADLASARSDLLAMEEDLSNLSADNGSLTSDLQSTQSDLASLQEDYDYATRNITKLEAKAKAKLAEADEALADAKKLRSRLKDQEAAARAVRRRLDKELGVVLNSKFGDGVWHVGPEIAPGIYRSPAGGSCYWAILNSADTSDISSNGGFSANQTVTLTSGRWFQTSDCGDWSKIG